MSIDHLRWRKSSHSNADACVELAPIPDAAWRKSTRSSSANNCVELAPAAPLVAARDSKRPTQPHLAVEPQTWSRFAAAVRTGHFDLA